jgi:hypothetical protein
MHRLHFRSNNKNLYFHAGKLFQEYCCTSWIKVETNNLHYMKKFQDKLKISNYSGLMNHSSTNYTPENINLGHGRAYVLPSTFVVYL